MLKDRTNKPVITHRLGMGLGGRPPKSLDYWQITFAGADDAGVHVVDDAAMAALERIDPTRYGPKGKPRRLPVRVDSDDIEDFLHQAYESRVSMPVVRNGQPVMVKGKDGTLQQKQGLQLWCHGDGVKAKRLGKAGWADIRCCSSAQTHEARTPAELADLLAKRVKHDPNDGRRCPWSQNDDYKAGPLCKPTTEVLLRCDAVANLGAVCRFRSHGHKTADAIVSSLCAIKAKMPGGVLTDVPLDLVLTMVYVGTPTGGRTLKPQAHFELRFDEQQTARLLEANLQQRVATTGMLQQRRMELLQARTEAKDTADDAAAEFVVDMPSGGLGR